MELVRGECQAPKKPGTTYSIPVAPPSTFHSAPTLNLPAPGLSFPALSYSQYSLAISAVFSLGLLVFSSSRSTCPLLFSCSPPALPSPPMALFSLDSSRCLWVNFLSYPQ